jgi:hypothetical protein
MIGTEPAAFRGSGPFLKVAPPLSLPLRHFALAALAFPLFAAGLFFGADRLTGFGVRPLFALGLVHVLTMGWILQTILGAWMQMIPVHGETPLVSVRAAKLGWWLFAAGMTGFIATLWRGSLGYAPWALLVYAGVLLELAVLGLTHARAARRDRTWTHFCAAFAWLAALGLVGVLMAFDRQRGLIFARPDGALIAHAHMALVGFAGLTVFGAGYRLFPGVAMFQLRSRREGKAAFVLLNAGLAGLAADQLFFGGRLTPAWALFLAAAYALYFSQLRSAFDSGPSRDPSTLLLLVAVAGGALWAALGVGLAFGWVRDAPSARAAYAFCALVGFYTPVILSQVHKIAPFLVWLHVYSPRDWKPPVKVPKIDDLTSRRLAWAEAALLTLAAPLGAAGFWREAPGLIRTSGALLLLCAAVYALNTALTLMHVLRPDARWTLPER